MAGIIVFLDFLAVLFLLTIVFWLLAMVAGLAIATPLMLFDPDRGVRGIRRQTIAGQVLQSVIFSALVALATVAYTANRVASTWPYVSCGLLSTYFVLSTHVYETGKRPSALRAQVSNPAAVHEGALLGFILGLAAFLIVYLWSVTVGILPGVSQLISVLVGFSERVSHFWPIRIVLLWFVIVYIFKVGVVALLTPVMAVSEIIRRKPNGTPPKTGSGSPPRWHDDFDQPA